MGDVENYNFTKNMMLIESIKDHERQNLRETEEVLINNLLEATFLVPVLKNRESNDGEINLLSIQNVKGDYFFPVFTEKNELEKWNEFPGKQVIFMDLFDYNDIFSSEENKWSGIVVDPFGSNLVLNTVFIKKATNTNKVIRKNESVMLGEPSVYPEQLVNGLKRYFQSNHVIEKAYLLLMIKNDEQSYLLVVDSVEDSRQLFEEILNESSNYLKGNEKIDLVSYKSQFGRSSVNEYQPFYCKLD